MKQDAASLDDDWPEQLIRAHRTVLSHLNGALGPAGLSVDQWRVLRALSDGEGHTVSALAKALSLNLPTLSKILDRLSEHALVFRQQDEHDQRRVNVFASDFGLEALAEAQREVDRARETFAGRLSEAEAKRLVRLLHKLNS